MAVQVEREYGRESQTENGRALPLTAGMSYLDVDTPTVPRWNGYRFIFRNGNRASRRGFTLRGEAFDGHPGQPMNGRYEEDFYAWAKAQADLLRARQLSDLDLDHLIEEIDGLAEARHRSVRARTRRIIEHLLLLEHSPARDQRGGWAEIVRTQRSDLDDQLSASLRPKIEQASARIYDRARRNATAVLQEAGEGAAADALPETCPYSLDQITGDWLP